MREHREEFKPFLDVSARGASELRRAPRRAGRNLSSVFSSGVATAQEIVASMDAHILRISKDREWADQPELLAAAGAFGINIGIYKEAQSEQEFEGTVVFGSGGAGAPLCRLAFHKWQHYSSVRSSEGLFQGTLNTPAAEPAEKQRHLSRTSRKARKRALKEQKKLDVKWAIRRKARE